VLPAAADSIRPQAGSQKKQQQSQRGDAGCDAAGSLSEPLSPSKNVTRQQGLHHHQRTDTDTHGAIHAAAASSTHRDHTLVQPAPSRQSQRRRSAFSLQEYYVDVAHGCVCLADPSERADSREQNTQPFAAAASVDAAAIPLASTQQHRQHQQHAEHAGSAPGQQAHARATGTSPHDAEAAWPPHDAEPEVITCGVWRVACDVHALIANSGRFCSGTQTKALSLSISAATTSMIITTMTGRGCHLVVWNPSPSLLHVQRSRRTPG
jgi:hypothetical protein